MGQTPCAATPQTLRRIELWIYEGVDPGEEAFSTVNCVAASAAGEIAGGAVGMVAGSQVAGAAAGALSSYFCGDDEKCNDRGRTFGQVAGGIAGALFGAASGGDVARQLLGRSSLNLDGSPEEAMRECSRLFGLSRTQLGLESEIEKAYRHLAREAHPDKPGGSTDAMSKLNICREILRIGNGAPK